MATTTPRDTTVHSTATMAVVLDGASVTGAVTLANAALAIPDGKITMDNILDVGMVTNTYCSRDDACMLTVELKNGAVWNVTEVSYVSELTVDDSSAVNGTVMNIGNGFVVSPAAGSGEAPAAAGGPQDIQLTTFSEIVGGDIHLTVTYELKDGRVSVIDIVDNDLGMSIYDMVPSVDAIADQVAALLG